MDARGLDEFRLEVPVSVGFAHRLRFVPDALGGRSQRLREVFEQSGEGAARVLVVLDGGLVRARPTIEAELSRALEGGAAGPGGPVRVAGPAVVLPGGEACKNDPSSVERVLRAAEGAGICRKSYILAVGGGAVLDAAGYAAAICHRGVRLVRLPTTTLSQGDSGVGVKCGVNAFGKKNFLGCFAVPDAVVCDETLLATLPQREWLAGFSEAVKVGVVRDAGLFDLLEREGARIARREGSWSAALRRSAEIHLRHIAGAGDPFERAEARPLDFGHWSAHRLEAMSGFALRHGEAVSVGIALDCVYASAAGLWPRREADRVLAVLAALGLPISHPLLGEGAALMTGLDEFREHLGGRLTITLPAELGRGIDVHEIDRGLMLRCAAELVRRPCAAAKVA